MEGFEMATYAALVSLINNIEQIMSHPRLSTFFHNNQIQLLEEKAALLLYIIEYGGVPVEEDLERQIASTAHAAEDVIESHMVEQIHAGSSKASTVDLQQMIQDMDAISRKANELKENHALKEEQPAHPRPPTKTGGESDIMVGFDDELIQLMDELTGHRSSQRIISIVGMGGMGKTTLAKNIYANPLINQHFDIRAWATVSQQYSDEAILSQLVSGGTVGESGERLHKTLSGRRYLIVLDDIWSREAWDEVRCFFPDNRNGSRVVLTTRLSNVATDCGSTSCFTMKPLDEHETWKLFCTKAFQQENCPYPQLEKVGKEIARLCRGLPLSTVVIGGLLLNSPRSVHFWENVAANIKSNPDSKEKEESLDILSLSYNHLSPHLKPCFLYMGVFREDSEIRVSKLIKLWIAEGFIRPNNTQNLEEVAEDYLKELIDRNLILVSKRRGNGKVGSCGIHDLLRDLCLKVGEAQELFHVSKGEIRGTERRLIGSDWFTGATGAPLARSMLRRSKVEQPVNYKMVRVWDECYFESGAAIYGNVNLRYLAYQDSYRLQLVRELPTSLSLIWNLQTLVIKQPWSCKIVVAPIEIWKMRQLRHVKCPNLYLGDPPSDGLLVMENLQTLKSPLNLRVSEQVCKIIPNIKKLHLVYDGDEWTRYDDSLIECLQNLDCLQNLESLKLNIQVRLTSVNNKIITFPISLSKLSLSGAILGWEDLWMVGSLPQLQALELIGIPCAQWSPVDDQFLRLKCLKLDSCHLCCWEADNSHFPVLEKLLLRNLQDLEEIPLGMSEIPTLELIGLDSCSVSAAISALRIKEDELENQGEDALQIRVAMSELDMELFKERVETEGMPINATIHFNIF